MPPGELNASSHMCMRPRVQGNFKTLQCKYFQNSLCAAEVFCIPSDHKFPKGNYRYLLSAGAAREYWDTQGASVKSEEHTLWTQRDAGGGGVYPHWEGVNTQTQCPQVSNLGKGRIIYTCLILTLLLRHPSLVVGGDKKLGYRTPNTVIFMSLFGDGQRNRGATRAQTALRFLWFFESYKELQ